MMAGEGSNGTVCRFGLNDLAGSSFMPSPCFLRLLIAEFTYPGEELRETHISVTSGWHLLSNFSLT